MFRSTRWRSDKHRIKAVFKLHFHATQVLQSGVDSLALSIIPGDVGRPTTRLENATVRDGVCRWENPVYQTVKFIQDPKTGKINERIYYFEVSTGLSRASSIGEVSFNFADFGKATKQSCVSLPIKNSRCGAVLHVSIQRLQENGDQREEEESEDVKIESHERSFRTYLSNGDTDDRTKMNSVEDVSADAINHRVELSADCRTSSESDITLSSSDGSSGLDTPRRLGSRNTNNIHHNQNASTLTASMYERSHWDWSASSDHGLSTENSPNGSHLDALPKELSQEASDLEIERLKAELAALIRQVDVSDLELQTLRKQIVKESKRGQELSKEVISLKEERDALKAECDNLRSFHKRMDEAKVRNRSQLEGGDLRTLVEEIRQELNYEKDLNANLRLQLKKTQESNAELVLAVQDLDQMLDQKNMEIYNLSNKEELSKNSQELRGNLSKYETDDDEEQKVLEEIVKEHGNSENSQLLEQKIIELYGEIDMYKRDKDELEMQMEQLALDYEILKQENHGLAHKLEQSQLQEQLKQYECSYPADAVNDLETHIESLENELKKQSKEFSDSLATSKELESHIRTLEEDLEEQARGFEADLEAVTRDKVEQEQRAIRAEEALRKTRLKNANAAERLQEEFGRLSTQMASTFDANEKAAMKALAEANELRAQKSLLEEMLQKVREELQSVKDDYEVKLSELSNQIESMAVQIQKMLIEIEEKSKEIEKQKNHEEQINREFSEEKRILKAENERLKGDVIYFSEQAEQKESLRIELELKKKSVEECKTLLQRGTVERNELVSTIALLKKEAEKTLEELNRMRHVKDEKETMARFLQSELEAVRDECNDLKHSLLEDEAEKQKLRKQISQLKGELKKKEDALTNIEKKFKDTNGHQQLSATVKNKKSASIPQNSKEIASLREKIKMLEGQIKSKETASEASKNLFLQKEKELQNKIEELESRVAEFNQSSALQKVAEDQSITTLTDGVRDTAEHLNDATSAYEENGDVNLSEKEAKTSVVDKRDDNLSDMLTELATLMEKNKSMESELKEMQERYTEMSLRFAEVEGERQKLVMTVRNLRIAYKVK